jgi:hypothetical protein
LAPLSAIFEPILGKTFNPVPSNLEHDPKISLYTVKSSAVI